MTTKVNHFIPKPLPKEEFLGQECICWFGGNLYMKRVLEKCPAFNLRCTEQDWLGNENQIVKEHLLEHAPYLLEVFREDCRCNTLVPIEIEVNIPYPLSSEEQKEYDVLFDKAWEYDDYLRNVGEGDNKGLTDEEQDRLQIFVDRLQEYEQEVDRLVQEIVDEMD